eukprot:g31398.t1
MEGCPQCALHCPALPPCAGVTALIVSTSHGLINFWLTMAPGAGLQECQKGVLLHVQAGQPMQFAGARLLAFAGSCPRGSTCWLPDLQADLALSSCDFRTTYTVSVSQSTLQIVSFDGLQPNGAKDNRSTDISALPQVQKKKVVGDIVSNCQSQH